MQIPGQGVVLHQAVSAILNAFAPAEPVSEASIILTGEARVMKLMSANGSPQINQGILSYRLRLGISQRSQTLSS